MALEKQSANIPFGQGIDTKTDPNQLEAGKFLLLENAVFNTTGLLEKRKGFPNLTTLNADVRSLSTLNNNLLASGTNLYALSASTNQWTDQGLVEAISLQTQAVVRTDLAQTFADSAISEAGLLCTTYVQNGLAYYQISDKVTNQIIIKQTPLPATAKLPRVFLLNQWFIITFMRTDTVDKLSYVAVPKAAPSTPLPVADITSLVNDVNAHYDGVVANDSLYLSFNASDVGGATRIIKLTSSLIVSTSQIVATVASDLIALAADVMGNLPAIYVAHYENSATTLAYKVYNPNLLPLLANTVINSADELEQITVVAKNGTGQVLYQVNNDYSYVAERTDYIQSNSITSAGAVGSNTIVVRSLGIASKAFQTSTKTYLLATYGSPLQPSYFLIDSAGNVISRLAYSNGFGYVNYLPSVVLRNGVASITYLQKTLVTPVNKSQGATNVNGVFALTGVNVADFTFDAQQYNAETALSQHYTGGQLWQYDGQKPVELGFHVWADEILGTTSNGAGTLAPQVYYYIFTYEWTDAQGNVHKSAPSIPYQLEIVAPNDTVTLSVPTLRVTAKNGTNKVRIVGYRWSAGQQTYYQFTSATAPTLNNTAVDSVSITDTLNDSEIIGNTILYTSGGVIENIAPPANSSVTLYKNRLFLLDSENSNTVWFSKQLVQGVPVETSDLLTIYVPPTKDAPGRLTAIAAMDDKLIFFKAGSLQYIVGIGPDNTGAQNDFNDPVLITSTVGCTNQNSIVSTPIGLMFQSDKGIWLLGRDLSTTYIGADVDAYANIPVTSAVSIPGTNQIRFTLVGRQFLVYDYYYEQWGTFTNLEAIDSLVYAGTHTILEANGTIKKQSLDKYLDATSPVLMKFITAWLKLTGLQGFQRAYFFYLLGNYKTPHKLSIDVAYDFNSSPTQTSVIAPSNYSPPWGDDVVWGATSPWGGESDIEQYRVFLARQKCQAVQISCTEVYDKTKDAEAGAGLTMSGINLVVGAKKGYPTLPAKQSVG